MHFSPFKWSGTLPRKPFWIACLTILVLTIAIFFVITSLNWPKWIGLTAVALAQLALWPLCVRRLHDAGRSGYWSLLLLSGLWIIGIPIIGALRPKPQPENAWPHHGSHRVAQAGLILILLLALSRAVWEPFSIPSGNMKPTLLIGDYVIGVRASTAKRGEVIVFNHPATGQSYVARVIGLSGDLVQITNGTVHLNGTAADMTALPPFREVLERQGPFARMPICANDPVGAGQWCDKEQFRETLPDGASQVILNIGATASDHTGVYTVPAGHIFVLGDNRDNSIDSRIPLARNGVGFVPLEAVSHRAARILFSTADTKPKDRLHSAPSRFWLKVN
ncbi:MAG: signal peptidase I [Shimia sp.]|uniref:signal peptidase I n=1 Tax=Shimia sp. TaxID=1954381 RepID=UPI0040595868